VDTGNNCVRRISATGTIASVAGVCSVAGGFEGDGGPAVSARLLRPRSIVFDPAGNLYIADQSNSRIRRVTPAGVIATIAGIGGFGRSGDNGAAVAADIGHLGDWRLTRTATSTSATTGTT